MLRTPPITCEDGDHDDGCGEAKPNYARMGVLYFNVFLWDVERGERVGPTVSCCVALGCVVHDETGVVLENDRTRSRLAVYVILRIYFASHTHTHTHKAIRTYPSE